MQSTGLDVLQRCILCIVSGVASHLIADRESVHCRSKLANLLFTYELARRLPLEVNVTANALHPGVVQTELQR